MELGSTLIWEAWPLNELTFLEKRLAEKNGEIFRIYKRIKDGLINTLKGHQIKRHLDPWDSVINYYTLHEYSHCENVLTKLNQLLQNAKLNEYELFYVLSAVWIHDIGMIEYPLKMD